MIGLQISMLLLVLTIAALFFVVTIAVMGQITENQRLVGRRVSLIVGKKPQAEKKNSKSKKKRHSETEDKNGYQASQTIIQKIADAIFDELIAADIMMKPEEFAIIWLVLAFVPAALAALFSRNPMLPAILVILGVMAPILVVKKKQGDRVKQFDAQLSDALLICCNCLRSGLTFAQAMENIAEEMDAPVGTEFKHAVNEMNYGASMEEALNNMLNRIDSPDLMLTIAAVSVQRQTGGNLSEILEVISNTIRDRLKIKAEIKTMTTQGRFSGMIIGALPIFLGIMISIINPTYMMTFFTTSTGLIMLLISVLLEVIGFVAINKVVQIKY